MSTRERHELETQRAAHRAAGAAFDSAAIEISGALMNAGVVSCCASSNAVKIASAVTTAICDQIVSCGSAEELADLIVRLRAATKPEGETYAPTTP